MHRSGWVAAVGLGVALLAFLTSTPSAAATAWVVDDDGWAVLGDCDADRAAPRRIGVAIRNARAGDRIVVCPGTFEEVVRVPRSKPGLTIAAAGGSRPIIQAPPTGGDAAVWLLGKRTTLRNLRIEAPVDRPCDRPYRIALLITGPSSRVDGVRVRNVGDATLGPCAFEIGIDVATLNGPSPERVVIERVRVRDFGRLGVNLGMHAVLRDSTVAFVHDSPSPGVGFDWQTIGVLVSSRDGPSAVIRTRVHSGPSAMSPEGTRRLGEGIVVIHAGDGHRPVVRDNSIERVEDGVFLKNSLDQDIRANTIRDVTVGVRIEGVSGGIVRENEVAARQNGLWLSTSEGMTFSANVIDAPLACRDVSTGDGSFGTANIWDANVGGTSDPPGICAPA
jgi:hypothetical protein